MRNLTSVQSAQRVAASISAQIKATDTSTLWTFHHEDIVGMSPVSWEVPFAGGLGKTSNYKFTLSSSEQFIKTNFKNFIKAEVRLRVDLNNDTFYPHVGRIRQVKRNAKDPNLLEFSVFDQLFDVDPKFPVEAITTSYSTAHPEVSGSNMGYPVYYGKHTRPFFHTPVDCNLGTLLGPRNVSSENHVNSVWFSSRKERGTDTNRIHNILLNTAWDQQSGSTNVMSHGVPFEVRDVSAENARIFQIDNTMFEFSSVTSQTVLLTNEGGKITAQPSNGGNRMDLYPILNKRIPSEVTSCTGILFTLTVSNFTGVDSLEVRMYADTDAGVPETGNSIYYSTGSAETFASSIDQSSIASTQGMNYFTDNKRYRIGYKYAGTVGGSTVVMKMAMGVFAGLESDSYKNFSIFSPQVNCSDVAFSENPMNILTDIFGQSSFSVQLEQSSATQVDVSSYNFQCGFYEREKVSDIAEEFGEITATYLWLGDSGQLNSRTYQDSSNVTIDTTIATSDFIDLDIRDNPVGTTAFNVTKAKRVQVDFDIDFMTKRNEKFLVADPVNTALCNSMQASGIDKEIVRKTRYIKETATGSYYLGNLVRKHCQGEQIIQATLPARYFVLELADVVKVQHPLLIGSESLYQVTRITPDYIRGTVKLQAEEILNGV